MRGMKRTSSYSSKKYLSLSKHNSFSEVYKKQKKMKKNGDRPKKKSKFTVNSSDSGSQSRDDSEDEFEEKVQKAPIKVKR